MKSLESLLDFWGAKMVGCPVSYEGRNCVIIGRTDYTLLLREFGSDSEFDVDVYSRELVPLATKVVVNGNNPLFFIDENSHKFYMGYGLTELPSVYVPLYCVSFGEFLNSLHLVGDTEVFCYKGQMYVGTLAEKGDIIAMDYVCDINNTEYGGFELGSMHVESFRDVSDRFNLVSDSRYFNAFMQYDFMMSRIKSGNDSIHE